MKRCPVNVYKRPTPRGESSDVLAMVKLLALCVATLAVFATALTLAGMFSIGRLP